MAAATAAAAASTASRGGREGFWRATGDGGTKDGKLECGFLAGAFGTGDFLLLVQDQLFELGFAIVANVFVDGHLIRSGYSLAKNWHRAKYLKEHAEEPWTSQVRTIQRDVREQSRLFCRNARLQGFEPGNATLTEEVPEFALVSHRTP